MDEQPGSVVRDVAKSAAAGAGRAIGTLLAAALICGVLGAGVGWWFGGTNLAILGLVLGGVAGLAVWLAVYFLLNS